MCIMDRWPRFSAHTNCTLSRSLLLSSDKRNWATPLSGSRRADYQPSQLRLRNRISPRRPPVEGTQPCVTDAANAIVQFIECTPLRNYDRSNSECQKTEFEFINRTSNFRTSFNNPNLNIARQITHPYLVTANLKRQKNTSCMSCEASLHAWPLVSQYKITAN